MSCISYNFLPASNVDAKFFSFLNMMLNREPRIPLMWQKVCCTDNRNFFANKLHG